MIKIGSQRQYIYCKKDHFNELELIKMKSILEDEYKHIVETNDKVASNPLACSSDNVDQNSSILEM